MLVAGVFDLGIDIQIWPWVWLAVAVIFALVELTLIAGSFVLLPFAISAFAASILGFYDVSIELQWLVFGVGGAALFFVMYRWARRFSMRNVTPMGVGAGRLVGMTATVTVTIDPADPQRKGRVRVVSEDWGAICDMGEVLPTGSVVQIIEMRGTRVVVRPV